MQDRRPDKRAAVAFPFGPVCMVRECYREERHVISEEPWHGQFDDSYDHAWTPVLAAKFRNVEGVRRLEWSDFSRAR